MKDDLLAYLENRIEKLRSIKLDMPETEPDDVKRKKAAIKIDGQIRELESLKKIIETNSLKRMSMMYA